jgi:histidinol-phosphate aminotransferase
MMDIIALARPEIAALKPYQSARSTAAADGILLNANEAPWPLLEDERWQGLDLNRYPQPQPAQLTSRLADLYRVPDENLLVTRGSDEGIDLLVRVFCRAGVDAIAECPPCFGMYRIAAGIQGASTVQVPRESKSLRVDVAALCAAITSDRRIHLVFLTSPNNPSGDLLGSGELDTILSASKNRAIVVLDEAYIEFTDTPSASELVAGHPNLVVLRTLSKAWAAAGLRCGAVIADPQVIDLLKRVMAPYPLTAPGINAALTATSNRAADRQREMLRTVRRGRNRLLDFLTQQEWVRQSWPGDANFLLMRVDDATGLVAWCAENGIRIRDFSNQPQLENCVRLTIGSEEEMEALETVLTEYRRKIQGQPNQGKSHE